MSEELCEIEKMLSELEMELKGPDDEFESTQDQTKTPKSRGKDEKISKSIERMMSLVSPPKEEDKKIEEEKPTDFTCPQTSPLTEKSREETKSKQNRLNSLPAFSGSPVTTPKSAPLPKRPKSNVN